MLHNAVNTVQPRSDGSFRWLIISIPLCPIRRKNPPIASTNGVRITRLRDRVTSGS